MARLTGKGGKSRVVTVSQQCTTLVRDYLSSSGMLGSADRHVFPSQTREHMTVSCVEEIVKKYVRMARIKKPALFKGGNYTPHSFRHSIAVYMLEAGVPLAVIKNFLGHSSIKTTTVYATVSYELKDRYLKEGLW